MMVFLVPLSKRCTGARTIAEIFSSIEVGDVNIPDIVMVVLCKMLPAKDFLKLLYALFTVVSNSYAKIIFLPKRPLQTYVRLFLAKCTYEVLAGAKTVRKIANKNLQPLFTTSPSIEVSHVDACTCSSARDLTKL
jgi:hypothetical protein